MRYLQQLKYIDAVARTGSIRRAAQSLAITSTALNRRILSMEEDLGTSIFERTGKGVRLSVAGEIFIHHARQQMSDLERVKSQIADLQGERRGRVSVACGQALMQSFLPDRVASYRRSHPGVDFRVSVCGRHEATDRLLDFSADIAVIFEPELSADVSVVMQVSQSVEVLMHQHHPLAGRSAVTLSDCAQYPWALPSKRSGLRALIGKAVVRQSLQPWMALESDSAELLLKGIEDQNMLCFQISVGLASDQMPAHCRRVAIASKELRAGNLVVLQLKGRTLPVASARFMNQLCDGLSRLA